MNGNKVMYDMVYGIGETSLYPKNFQGPAIVSKKYRNCYFHIDDKTSK